MIESKFLLLISTNMDKENIIGIDLGGTHVRVGIVSDEKLLNKVSVRIPASGSVEEVLKVIYDLVDPLFNKNINGIGIGVPSVVDI